MSTQEFDELLSSHRWADLTDAYGSAADVPTLLRTLQAGDRVNYNKAYDELYDRLAHQGISRFEASAPAVPFLVRLAAESEPSRQIRVMRLLASIAIGDISEWFSTDLAEMRAKVSRESRPETGAEGDFFRDARRWALQAYDATKEGTSAYIRILDSGNIETSMWSAYLLGWFPEKRREIVPALLSCARKHDDEHLTATVCVAVGLLGDVGASTGFLADMLESGTRMERSAGAIGRALLSPELEDTVVDELAACVERDADSDDRGPYGSLSVFASMFVERIGDGWIARPSHPRAPNVALGTDHDLS